MGETKLIYQKMAAIMKDVEAIGKDNTPTSGAKYNFRGIDDMYNAIHDLMAKHEVFCMPVVVDSERGEYTTAKGTKMQHVTSIIKYSYYATDGSYVESSMVGEGADTGDKATAKSCAMAHKYNLVQSFLIKTGDKVDNEHERNDMSGGKSEPEKIMYPKHESEQMRENYMMRMSEPFESVEAFRTWWMDRGVGPGHHLEQMQAEDAQAVKDRAGELKKEMKW
jgi:hypothetical protein